jgi:hypothetical protein
MGVMANGTFSGSNRAVDILALCHVFVMTGEAELRGIALKLEFKVGLMRVMAARTHALFDRRVHILHLVLPVMALITESGNVAHRFELVFAIKRFVA